jgi:formate-dependent nitrite reductase membrane component NrfD
MVTPITDDGRNLDPALADERGEGATITVERPPVAWPIPPEAHPAPDEVPSETYYELPVVKAAPWRWYVPAYFYVGGVSGAAATLAPFVPDKLARKLHWISAIGDAASAALLVADLGKPTRFANMLRVFRPTSPMNIGTWILSAAGASSGLSLLFPRSRVVGTTGAVAGSALATYTAVLIGNTAIPIWNATRTRLPPWFAASSAAGLASLLELIAPRTRGLTTYGIVAKVGELTAAYSVESAAKAAGVDAPLREGRSGRMWRAARWLGGASLVATLLSRPRIAGALGTAAGLLSRFAIIDAGRASAADPRATFEPQHKMSSSWTRVK